MWPRVAPILLYALMLPQAVVGNELVAQVRRLDNGLRVLLVEEPASRHVSVQLWLDVDSGSIELAGRVLRDISRRESTNSAVLAGSLFGGAVYGERSTLAEVCFLATTVPVGGLQTELCRYAGLLGAGGLTCATYEPVWWDRGWAMPCSDGLWRILQAAAYPLRPYRDVPNDSKNSTPSINAGAASEFRARWFVPGNATLVVVGAIKTDDVLPRIRQRFGRLPWADVPPRARPASPPAELLHLPAAEGDDPGLDLAWVTPGAAADELAALDVLMHLLCNPVDGPLYARLTAAGCRPPRWTRQAWREAGLLVLSVDFGEEGTEEGHQAIEALVGAELANAIEHTPSEVALNRARAAAARDVRNRRASFHDWALELGWSEVVAGDVQLAAWELPRREQLRVGDLQRAAALLRDARTVVQPRVARTGGCPNKPTPTVCPGTLPKRTAGHTPVVVELGNGVVVRVLRMVDAGPTVVETRVEGVAELGSAMQALLAVGSTELSAPQLRDYLSYRGLDLSAVCKKGKTGLISRGDARDVPQMVELQALLLQKPDTRPGDAMALRAALAALDGIRRVEVQIIGDIEPQAAEKAVRDVWEGWRQYNPPPDVQSDLGVSTVDD